MIPGPLLVIIPHCDDEVLQAGGLLARANREGMATYVAPCRVEDGRRMIELKESAELLGFEIVDWVSNTWGDGPWLGRRWEDPSMQMTGLIEQALEMTAAETVVLPGVNTHQEHRLVRDATLAALRPSANSGRHRPRYVLSAESPTDSWAREPDGRFWVELDRSDVDRKLAAIYLHESQRREGLTERSTFVLQALAQLRGAEAGVPRAERYRVERILL